VRDHLFRRRKEGSERNRNKRTHTYRINNISIYLGIDPGGLGLGAEQLHVRFQLLMGDHLLIRKGGLE